MQKICQHIFKINSKEQSRLHQAIRKRDFIVSRDWTDDFSYLYNDVALPKQQCMTCFNASVAEDHAKFIFHNSQYLLFSSAQWASRAFHLQFLVPHLS